MFRLFKEVNPKEVSGSVLLEYNYCFETKEPLTKGELEIIQWLIGDAYEQERISDRSFIPENERVIEVGARMEYITAHSTNAINILKKCGINKITRLEKFRRYRAKPNSDGSNIKSLYDMMTEAQYAVIPDTFNTGRKPEPVRIIPLMERGRVALEDINKKMGLNFDEFDIDYYNNLFVNRLKRNPRDVELFDVGQSNSDHSRHWFFKGILYFDGEKADKTLWDIIRKPWQMNPNNSVIAFKDNSSAIRGYDVTTIVPGNPGQFSNFRREKLTYHLIFTAETHNFPSGVAPFPGAETGTGGRLRDVHATGRGALVIAGTVAYCVGNLRIPGYIQPWEADFFYPTNLASPLEIEIKASDGASDYGNKFGEPGIVGSNRAFEVRMPDGRRRGWLKPIMFTGGIGQMRAEHVEKEEAKKGMLVKKIGGPGYRIGMGGGSASSMISGQNTAERDYNAVQRGDAEMECKVDKVIWACVMMGNRNPILSIHDQGAGGNCNVTKEIIFPAGADIDVRQIQVGDATLSVLEKWGAEYQEQYGILIDPGREAEFDDLCARENVPCACTGTITGNGKIILYDSQDKSVFVDLDLKSISSDMGQKDFHLMTIDRKLEPLVFPDDITISKALDRVLRLVSAGSKRHLTKKLDRSVKGRVARQQEAGRLQLTVSDVGVVSQGFIPNEKGKFTGGATSIGEKPILSLISPEAMGRMCVVESITNLLAARFTSVADIKYSGNWMAAPKQPGEGIDLYHAAESMSDFVIGLKSAVDGGKDSFSMAAHAPDGKGGTEIVISPIALFMSAYVTVDDITKVLTPDIKKPGGSKLYFFDLGDGNTRMGGTALAQCYNQVGDESPDIEFSMLERVAETVLTLHDRDLLLAYHDRSDDGLITTVLEMAFSGNCGFKFNHPDLADPIAYYFNGEAGIVVEVDEYAEDRFTQVVKEAGLEKIVHCLGETTDDTVAKIAIGKQVIFEEDIRVRRDIWEETSFQLELLQREPTIVEAGRKNIIDRLGQSYHVPEGFQQRLSIEMAKKEESRDIKTLVLREEGINGWEEMVAAIFSAGLDPYDATMDDWLKGKTNLNDFQGLVFPGGFSYADVFGAGKGWAGVIKKNLKLWEEFQRFIQRTDTFGLGICNGCQSMALLGLAPYQELDEKIQPRFIENKCRKFVSDWVAVRILESPAIMLHGMAGLQLGVHVAHGEGFAHFPDKGILKRVLQEGLAPVRYVDDHGEYTERYPFNPNGSPEGIAALTTPDGRFLIMMPHPERAFLNWQWSWTPANWDKNAFSPWIKMFRNAREWCEKTK